LNFSFAARQTFKNLGTSSFYSALNAVIVAKLNSAVGTNFVKVYLDKAMSATKRKGCFLSFVSSLDHYETFSLWNAINEPSGSFRVLEELTLIRSSLLSFVDTSLTKTGLNFEPQIVKAKSTTTVG